MTENIENIDAENVESVEIEPSEAAMELEEAAENATALVYGAREELSFQEKVELARVITNFESIWPAVRDGDDLKLNVVNIICVPTDVTDRETGEVVGKNRTIFVTVDGEAWASTSDVVYSTVETIAGIFGAPSTWEEPLELTFRAQRSNNNQQFVNVIF